MISDRNQNRVASSFGGRRIGDFHIGTAMSSSQVVVRESTQGDSPYDSRWFAAPANTNARAFAVSLAACHGFDPSLRTEILSPIEQRADLIGGMIVPTPIIKNKIN